MIRKITGLSLLATAILGLFPLACAPGGVGDPCTPEDEYKLDFPGYNPNEVNVESKSFQCQTRVCLANHFRGRVSCKYGQDTPSSNCTRPGDKSQKISVVVDAQLKNRQADKAVYCSCRCDGEDKNARYCKCPSGYACTHLVDDLAIGGTQLAGSYCVRDGTTYDPSDSERCRPTGYPDVKATLPGEPTCGEPTEG